MSTPKYKMTPSVQKRIEKRLAIRAALEACAPGAGKWCLADIEAELEREDFAPQCIFRAATDLVTSWIQDGSRLLRCQAADIFHTEARRAREGAEAGEDLLNALGGLGRLRSERRHAQRQATGAAAREYTPERLMEETK